jgi:putative Mn2+ efflux pump MntP
MEQLFTSLLIGIGLAMDCFAVSLAAGAYSPAARFKVALVLASFFGFFQFGMCILGYGIGASFAELISAYDHWVACALLLAVGIKMIKEGLEDEESPLTSLRLGTVTVLAVATSIDALAVGISFAVLDLSPLTPAIIIGFVSLIFSVAGVYSGTRLERILGRKVDILGGAILILLGIWIVLGHTLWG